MHSCVSHFHADEASEGQTHCNSIQIDTNYFIYYWVAKTIMIHHKWYFILIWICKVAKNWNYQMCIKMWVKSMLFASKI